MKKSLDFFLYSNIFVAIGASFLTLYTYDLLVLTSNKLILSLFVFFSTILAYNFQRIFKKHSDPFISARGRWIHQNKKAVHILTAFSFLACIYLVMMLPYTVMILLLPLALISLWYAIGILKKHSKNQPLREVPLLKIFLISFVWVGACYLLPVVNEYGYHTLLDYRIQIIAIAVACFIFALTLPFDIRDIQIDKEKNLLTFPTKIGIYKTKMLSYLGFIFGVILFYYLYNSSYIGTISFLSFTATSLVAIVLVSFVTIERGSLYYALVLESCLLLPFTFSQILKLIN